MTTGHAALAAVSGERRRTPWAGVPRLRVRVDWQPAEEHIPVLDSPRAVADAFWWLAYEVQEVGVWIAVDARKRIVAAQEFSRGGVDATVLDPGVMFREILLAGPTAAGFLFVHNHPSGECDPSDEDRQAFTKLEAAGQLLRLPLIDAVIIGRQGVWSREGGHIPWPSFGPSTPSGGEGS